MFSVNGFLFYYELSKESQPLLSVGQNWELRAWRKMMKSVGCTNLTPYKKQKSKPEFWTCAKTIKEAIKVNKCRLDGKQRILSIITQKFGFREIQKKLQCKSVLNFISEIKDRELISLTKKCHDELLSC
ncbi:unnamed protein product [Rhizophagus irregularis]|nr:unnamed protein product [Rhizophagus irregularis]